MQIIFNTISIALSVACKQNTLNVKYVQSTVLAPYRCAENPTAPLNKDALATFDTEAADILLIEVVKDSCLSSELATTYTYLPI